MLSYLLICLCLSQYINAASFYVLVAGLLQYVSVFTTIIIQSAGLALVFPMLWSGTRRLNCKRYCDFYVSFLLKTLGFNFMDCFVQIGQWGYLMRAFVAYACSCFVSLHQASLLWLVVLVFTSLLSRRLRVRLPLFNVLLVFPFVVFTVHPIMFNLIKHYGPHSVYRGGGKDKNKSAKKPLLKKGNDNKGSKRPRGAVQRGPIHFKLFSDRSVLDKNFNERLKLLERGKVYPFSDHITISPMDPTFVKFWKDPKTGKDKPARFDPQYQFWIGEELHKRNWTDDACLFNCLFHFYVLANPPFGDKRTIEDVLDDFNEKLNMAVHELCQFDENARDFQLFARKEVLGSSAWLPAMCNRLGLKILVYYQSCSMEQDTSEGRRLVECPEHIVEVGIACKVRDRIVDNAVNGVMCWNANPRHFAVADKIGLRTTAALNHELGFGGITVGSLVYSHIHQDPTNCNKKVPAFTVFNLPEHFKMTSPVNVASELIELDHCKMGKIFQKVDRTIRPSDLRKMADVFSDSRRPVKKAAEPESSSSSSSEEEESRSKIDDSPAVDKGEVPKMTSESSDTSSDSISASSIEGDPTTTVHLKLDKALTKIDLIHSPDSLIARPVGSLNNEEDEEMGPVKITVRGLSTTGDKLKVPSTSGSSTPSRSSRSSIASESSSDSSKDGEGEPDILKVKAISLKKKKTKKLTVPKGGQCFWGIRLLGFAAREPVDSSSKLAGFLTWLIGDKLSEIIFHSKLCRKYLQSYHSDIWFLKETREGFANFYSSVKCAVGVDVLKMAAACVMQYRGRVVKVANPQYFENVKGTSFNMRAMSNTCEWREWKKQEREDIYHYAMAVDQLTTEADLYFGRVNRFVEVDYDDPLQYSELILELHNGMRDHGFPVVFTDKARFSPDSKKRGVDSEWHVAAVEKPKLWQTLLALASVASAYHNVKSVFVFDFNIVNELLSPKTLGTPKTIADIRDRMNTSITSVVSKFKINNELTRYGLLEWKHSLLMAECIATSYFEKMNGLVSFDALAGWEEDSVFTPTYVGVGKKDSDTLYSAKPVYRAGMWQGEVPSVCKIIQNSDDIVLYDSLFCDAEIYEVGKIHIAKVPLTKSRSILNALDNFPDMTFQQLDYYGFDSRLPVSELFKKPFNRQQLATKASIQVKKDWTFEEKKAEILCRWQETLVRVKPQYHKFILKKIQLEIHPDKNPGNIEHATRVFSWFQDFAANPYTYDAGRVLNIVGYRTTEDKEMKKPGKVVRNFRYGKKIKESETLIRKAVAITNYNVKGCLAPIPDLNDADSIKEGLLKRIGTAVPEPEDAVKALLPEYVKVWIHKHDMKACIQTFLVEEVEKLLQWDEYVKNLRYDPARMRELNKIRADYDSYGSYEFADNREGKRQHELWSKIEAHVKWESYHGEKKFIRMIFARMDHFKVVFGPYSKITQKALYKYTDNFITDKPVSEHAKWIYEHLGIFGLILASDFSAFESHNYPWLMYNVAIPVIIAMWGPDMSKEFFNGLFELIGVNIIENNLVTARIDGKMMSGEVWTTIINTITCIILLSYFAEAEGLAYGCGFFKHPVAFAKGFNGKKLPPPGGDVKLFAAGDDCVMGARINSDIDPKKFTNAYMARYGMNIKMDVKETLSGSGFLSKYFSEQDQKPLCDPLKQLSKGILSMKYANSKDSLKKALARARAMSLLYEFGGCPIVSSYARCIMRLTKNIDLRPALIHTLRDDPYKYEEISRAATWYHSKKWYEHEEDFQIGSDSRRVISDTFDIPIDTQLVIEEYFDTFNDMTYPCEFDVPCLDILTPQANRDFYFDYTALRPVDAHHSVKNEVCLNYLPERETFTPERVETTWFDISSTTLVMAY